MVFRTLQEHFCYKAQSQLNSIFAIPLKTKVKLACQQLLTILAGIHLTLLLLLNSGVVPKTKGGVSEVRRAVKVSDSKTASDVVHGGQRHVTSLHYPPLNGSLTGAIAKSHQAIVVIQTGRKN